MKPSTRKFLSSIMLLVFVAAFAWRVSLAQTGIDQPDRILYFPETGHTVSGDFLHLYESVDDPVQIFGYPITESFHNPNDNTNYQYFERARFEMDFDKPPELRVKISELGYLLKVGNDEMPLLETAAPCRSFPEMGDKRVCYAFLEFFDANGGAAQFGYPVSNFMLRDNRIVQYFQLARFEWQHERPIGHRVVLSDLGLMAFKKFHENPVRLLPVPNPNSNLPNLVLDLRVHAINKYPFTHSAANQVLYVTIQDQKFDPVPGARIEFKILLPSGSTIESDQVLMSDQHGIVKIPYSFDHQPIGVVKVSVRASYEDIQRQTVTSFQIWH